ncbi:MAG: DUF4399 domain-containing protein [Gemmatimonadetes bacterium]|nr:DUF4399 domain-containing protein [Gemmatimonadota bacterium]
MKNVLALSFVCALGLAACGAPADEPAQEETPPPPAAFTVTILEPAEGSEVTGPVVTVRLAATVPILPAGDLTPNTGHHHLYLDADQTPAMVPVPSVPGSIMHMGNAASEFRFDSVQPGPHRLIAVVADGVHVPLQPWVVDTINFIVR